MNGLTRTFLVLLRLVIGWHFLVEGIDKVQSVMTGPTESSRPWTSEPYLREAAGPLAPYFRQQFGDPDAEALARLTLRPSQEDLQQIRPGTLLAPELVRDWQAYFDRFAAFYHLDEDQRTAAQAKLEEAKGQAARWLLGDRGTQDVIHSFPSGIATVKETPAEHIKEFKSLLDRLREAESKELPAFERDVAKSRLRSLKADVTKARTELLHDLNKPMRDALQSVLTDEQKKSVMPEKVPAHWTSWTREDWIHWSVAWTVLLVAGVWMLSMLGRIAGNQSREASRAGWVAWVLTPLLVAGVAAGLPLLASRLMRPDLTGPWEFTPDKILLFGAAAFGCLLLLSFLVRVVCALTGVTIWGWGRWLLAWVLAAVAAVFFLTHVWFIEGHWADWSRQELLDWLVAYGITAVGVCLLIGFLTRSACLAGAGLLLMFYLTMPPFPGVPDSPRAEGHYLFVNKNLIECLALLALATVPTGRWLGLDGLFSVLNPVRWFVKQPQPR
jgi:uncharacterized membrane protein YphA (DoxX/SURF4 family)